MKRESILRKPPIQELLDSINQTVKNSTLLVDFTTVTHYPNDKIKTSSRYISNLQDYQKLIQQFFQEEGFSFPSNDVNIIPKRYCVKKDEIQLQEEYTIDSYASGIVPLEKDTDIKKWHKFIESNKLALYSYTFFKDFEINKDDKKDFIEIGFYLLFNKDLTKKEISLVHSKLEPFLYEKGLEYIISEFHEKFEFITKKTLESSLKSSLAAVMARNMSHNIGSHVLNKMSQKEVVEHFFQKSRNNKLFLSYEIIEEKNEITKEIIWKETNEESTPYATPHKIYELSKFFGIDKNKETESKRATLNPAELSRVFNDYLKKRMDFVADVATSDMATLTNNKYLFKEVFRSFERNLLLLQSISGKEDKFNYLFRFEYCENNKIMKPGEERFIDPLIAMPNDVLGDQAFYIILENIIRNTAKHSGSSEDVIFTIRVTNCFPDYYKITIYDDVKFQNHFDLTKLIIERNANIAKRVLDDNNEIRKNGWGTIELKLAACYLLKVPITDIDKLELAPLGHNIYNQVNEDKQISENLINEWDAFVKSKESHICNKDNNEWSENPEEGHRLVDNKKVFAILQAEAMHDEKGFGYSFLLGKPQEILIVLTVREAQKYQDQQKINNFKKIGVEIISDIAFKKDFSANNENKRRVAHHNLLFIDSKLINEISLNETNLPQRQLELNNSEKESLLKILDSTKIDKTTLHEIEYLFWYKQNKKEYKILDKNHEEIFVPINESQKDIQLIIKLDHHGEAIDENALHYEPYGSVSIINNYLNSWDSDYKKKWDNVKLRGEIEDRKGKKSYKRSQLKKYREIYRGKLIESVEAKIMFIDERIQSALNTVGFIAENKGGTTKMEYHELFSKTNIIVPPIKVIDFNAKPILKSNGDWTELLEYFFKNTTDIDYLVIHFGLLESFRTDNEERKKVLKVLNEIKKNIQNKNLKIIITSGRGSTPDVRELELPFVSYSAISNYTLDPNNRSKFHLTNLLKSTRL